MLDETETKVLDAAIRVNTVIMAVVMGLLCGAILWCSTAILVLRGGSDVGAHLSLLSIFLPGYSVSWGGAWIGLVWGFVYGALSGIVLYRSYAWTLHERLSDLLIDSPAASGLTPPIFLFSGNALGIGLGALMALQLLLTTNWLVARGTASESNNAALLSQYLPGYTVSFSGSLVGAIEIFALAFVLSHVLAGIYNTVARGRATRNAMGAP